MKKKRYIIKNRVRFYIFAFVILLLVAFSISLFVSDFASAVSIQPKRSIVVRTGDTLWDIAIRENIDYDIREFIYEIRKVNNMDSAIVNSGDILIIPILE